ncbi:molybdopterin biosynthesis enzyme [Halovivax ruber XH-70]|uniref:Molybdopterin biosynthesis enzyme n=1 Tax=Halovivax ruber (strain DSM 18193 / JCM 13892 / XH-70) TaxID=797302 RepID=L0I6Z2_HALRX|nr:molybdopterin-binding protein [Halovivax ruber]AGB15295.1 molybdopterin biosynthesis enzyme [Halovivax ruber XH-70]
MDDDEAGPGTDGSVSESDGTASEADGTEPGTDGNESGTDGQPSVADDGSVLGVAVVSIGVGLTGEEATEKSDGETDSEQNTETDDDVNEVTEKDVNEVTDEEPTEATDVLAALAASIDGIEHEIAIRERVAADFDTVQATVSRLADRDDVDVVLTAGGVGIEPDDATVGAVGQLLDAELPAFETLFTTRVAERVGTDVLCVRPLAGVIAGVPVFCLPADVETATFAMSELVVPQLPRVVSLASLPAAGPDDEAEHT